MAHKWSGILRFVSLLRVEPFVFLVILVYIIKGIPFDQLVQDKLCLQKYELSKDYCLRLPQMDDNDDVMHMKSKVLSDVTQFKMYISLANTLPSVVMSLFVGPFIDKNINAKKLMMMLSIVMLFIESILLTINCYFYELNYFYLLISEILPAIFGGIMIALTAAWSYVSSVTPVHLRALRMTTVEVSLFASTPIGTWLGGNLLAQAPLFQDRELRNYSTVFLISTGACFIGFLLVWFLVNEQKDKRLFESHFPSEQENKPNYQNSKVDTLPDSKKSSLNSEKLDLSFHEPVPEKSMLSQLFDLQNVVDMFHTFTKERPYQIRMQITLLFISIMLYLMAYMGPTVFLYQYVQKIFNWSSQEYSNFVALNSLVNIVSTFVLVPIIIKVFKMDDLNFTLIGLHIILVQTIIRLISTSLVAFYISLIFGMLNSIGSVGIRTYLSKIVEPNELGQVFSLMSAIDACIPFLASLIFSNLFRLTIDTMPNMSFFLVALGLNIAIVNVFIVGCKSKRTLEMIEQTKKSEMA